MTERQARRILYRMGYLLHKDRARNWSLHHQGGYMVCDHYSGFVVVGADFDYSLDDVIEHFGL